MPVTTIDRLFYDGYLSQFLDQRQLDLDDDIASEAEDEILNNSDVVEARLLKKYSLERVCVNKDGTRTKTQESGQRYGKLTVSFSVPFTGSKELLEYHPNSYTSGLVYGSIRDGRIVVDIENEADDPESFRREFDSWYANMKKWLGGANDQVVHFSKSLPSRIKNGIDKKAQAARSAADVVSALGYEEMQDTDGRGAEPAGDAPHEAEHAVDYLAAAYLANAPAGNTSPEAEHAVDLKIPEREDTRNEFKETFSVPAEGGKSNEIKMEAVIAVAAFANAEGGRLFIGVNDDGKPVGLKRDLRQCGNSSDKLQLAIRDFVKSRLTGMVRMEFGFNGKKYLVIEVAKRKSRFVYVGDDFYIREGNTSRKLNPREAFEYGNEHRSA